MRAWLPLLIAALLGGAPPASASTGAPLRIVLMRSVSAYWMCGRCADDPGCRAKVSEGGHPQWEAMLREPPPNKVPFAPGRFGKPGIEGAPMFRVWSLYLVFPSALPKQDQIKSWPIDVDGVHPYVSPVHSDYGALVFEIQIYEDQMPPGRHRVRVRDAAGHQVFAHSLTFAAREFEDEPDHVPEGWQFVR